MLCSVAFSWDLSHQLNAGVPAHGWCLRHIHMSFALPEEVAYKLRSVLLSLVLKLKMAWFFYSGSGYSLCTVFLCRSLGATPHFRCSSSEGFKPSPHLIFLQTAVIRLTGISNKTEGTVYG